MIEYKKEGNIGVICFNTPPLNIMNHERMGELEAILDTIEKDESIHVAVMYAIGRSFGVGSDMLEIAGYLDKMTDEEYLDIKMRPVININVLLSDMRVPFICAVDAPAYQGGFEQALACDFIVASENAQFTMTGVDIGTFPGANGTTRLVQAMGERKTLEYLLTGGMLSARQAYEMGIVSKLAIDCSAFELAMKWAAEIAAKPPMGVYSAKAAVNGIMKEHEKYLLDMTLDIHRKIIATGSLRIGCAEFIAKSEAKKKAREEASKKE